MTNPRGMVSNIAPKFKVVSDSEFWGEMGQNYDHGIEEFAARYNLETSTVLALAIIEGQNEDPFSRISLNSQDSLTFPVFRLSFTKFTKYLWERKLQVLLSIGLSLLIVSLITGSWINQRRLNSTKQIIVQRQKGLAAFHKITSDDVKFSILPVDPNEKVPFIGRYVLSTIPAGAVLTEAKLLDLELNAQMTNRNILSIPIKIDHLSTAASPNTKVGLVFSKIEAPLELGSIAMQDVILLGIEKHENSATLVIGITQEQLELIQNVLGRSEIFLIQN